MVVLPSPILQKITDDFEILVIGDGSTDHSQHKLQLLEEMYG